MNQGIPMKQWMAEEAKRLGMTVAGVQSRYYHQKRYPNLLVRRLNNRVVFVVGQKQRPRLTTVMRIWRSQRGWKWGLFDRIGGRIAYGRTKKWSEARDAARRARDLYRNTQANLLAL